MKSTVRLMNGEDVLKILSEQAPVGACIMQDGRFCYTNSFFSTATGYTADELAGKDSLEIVVPEDRDMVRENTIKMLKGEIVSPYQFRVICKDNGIIWVMATVKSIRYHGRQAVLGNYMEITGRKQMEDAVRESEERYKELAGSITDVFFAMDQHLRYTYWNKASEILTGIRAEDAIGKCLLEMFPDTPGRRRAEKAYRDVLKTQQPQTFVNDFDIGSRHYIFEVNAYPSLGGISVFVKDVTQHKHAEEALKLQTTYFHQLFENSPDAIVMLDTDTKVVQANGGFEKLFGYSLEEIKGRPINELIIPKDRLEEASAVSQTIIRGQVFRKELVRRRKDGNLIDVSLVAYPICIDGKLVGIYSIYSDISERKQTEKTLREIEKEKSAFLEEAPVAIIHTDLDGRITYVNSRFELESGHSREGIIGKLALELGWFSVDTNKYFAERMAARLRGSLAEHWEAEFKRKDGQSIWVELEGKVLRKFGGAVGFQIIASNITERRQAEETLRHSEERYRTILEETGDGYFETDLAGNLTFVNDALIRISGYPKGELIGMNFRALRPKEEVRAVFEAYNRMYKTGEPLRNLFSENICKDGSHIFAETSAFPTKNDKGEIVGFRGIRRDITERRRMEEALRQSEERYRSILDEIEDSYFEVDLGGHFTFVNNSVCRSLGYSKEELIGMSYKRFSAEEDIESVFRVFNEVYQTGMPNKGFPWKVIHKDGAHGFAETSVSVLRDDKGGIVGFRGVGRDVTERRQAEEALRRSEERYRTMLEEMEEGYYEVDAAGNFTFVNDAMTRILGYSRDELIGMNYKTFTPAEAVKPIIQAYNHVYRTGELLKWFPMPEIRKDGTRILAEDSVFPLRNEQGQVIGFRGISRDITERRRIEEALRQSEENYRTLFDNSVIGTIVLDAETMKVVMANQAAAKIFRFDAAEEGIGQNPVDLIVAEDRERAIDVITKELLEQDLRMTHEFRATTKDGREIWISATGARIMHEGRLAGLICFTDITEQKRQNESLILTDRLASLGELASGAAHELNNPLTSIIGFSQLLMEKQVPDDIREDLKLINTEAQRAVMVTRNFLTFARKHAPMKEPSQVNNILEDVLRLRTHEHRANGIEIEKHFASDLPEVMVDYFQMQQVFVNIVINAEYFMINAHNRGTLTITTKEQNDIVVILFTDDGPGIPQENLRRIFDPFFTTKEAGKGTGLGLSICHGIVTEHGGHIYATSHLGKGATIAIELPVDNRRLR